MTIQIMGELFGEDERTLSDAKQVTMNSLNARVALWDGIEQAIKNRSLGALFDHFSFLCTEEISI